MNFDQALSSAQVLAAYYGAAIGECLVANQILDTQGAATLAEASAWLLCFDIAGGPSNWCWVAIISPAGNESVIYASDFRPIARTSGTQ